MTPDVVSDIQRRILQRVDPSANQIDRSTFRLKSGKFVIFRTSKPDKREDYIDYFFGIARHKIDNYKGDEVFLIFVCGTAEQSIVLSGKSFKEILRGVLPAEDGDYKMHIFKTGQNYEFKVTDKERIDVTTSLNNFSSILSDLVALEAGVPFAPASTSQTKKYWIFQANPQIWDIENALQELDEISYVTRQHADEIHIGDTAFLWVSGNAAGIIAVATVQTESTEMAELEQERKFAKDNSFDDIEKRVLVHVDKVLSTRILRTSLLAHPTLDSLPILTNARGTNFKLTNQEGEEIFHLIEESEVPVAFRRGQNAENTMLDSLFDENKNYVVRRWPSDAIQWHYSIQDAKLQDYASHGDFYMVVVGDFKAETEKVFAIPYSYLKKEILPRADVDARGRILFNVSKKNFRFNWQHKIPMDGVPFLVGASAATFDVGSEEDETDSETAEAAFWWVNQGDTYERERDGEYLWAPQQTKDGKVMAHHSNMTRLVAGDIVFHYANGKLRAVSEVTEAAIKANRPTEFPSTAWEKAGNLAKLAYYELTNPIPLENIPLEWRLEVPKGPFDKFGAIKQGYLFPLSDDFAQKLLERFTTVWPDFVLEYIELKNDAPQPETPTTVSEPEPIPAIDYHSHIERISEVADEALVSEPDILARLVHEVGNRGLLVRREDLMTAVVALQSGHLVLQGPPGTGKSSLAEALCTAFKVARRFVTAHEDWSTYEVIGRQTIEINRDGREQVIPVNGYFTETAIECAEAIARHHQTPSSAQAKWLVIDELNRAHIDKAFGELFTLLGSDELLSITLPHQPPGNREFVIPHRFRIIATLNSVDRQFVNSLSQGLRRRFTFLTLDIPAPRNGGETWQNISADASIAAQEFTLVQKRAAERVTKKHKLAEFALRTTLDDAAVYLEHLFEFAELVRYADKGGNTPYLPLGTAQLIDVVELFLTRTVLENTLPTDYATVMDWAVSIKLAPLFDADNIRPEQLEDFVETLPDIFKAQTRRELLTIANAGQSYIR